MTLNDTKLILANIYAPNRDDPDFFADVFTKIGRFSPNYFIIAGDSNLGLDPSVDRYGSGYNNSRAANWLTKHISASSNIDLWRYLYPDRNDFTWRWLKPTSSFSRLDYFLVSETFTQFVEGVKLYPGFRTDHPSLGMKVAFSCDKRGPGYWKLNTSLLRDKDFIEKINNLLEIELEDIKPGQYKKKWELIKLAVRGTMIQYSSRKKKSDKNKIEVLERKLKILEKKLVDSNPLFNDTEEQIRLVKNEIRQINKEKTKGAVIRAKSNWAFLGEKGTKYFLNLEKPKSVSKSLYRILNDQTQMIQGSQKVLKEIKNYYKNLYSSMGAIDTTYVSKLNIPKVPADIREELEQELSIYEISAALKDMSLNKSPGCNGLPADFYKMFYPKIKHFLLNLYLEVIETKELHLSARRGVLSLIEKIGKDMLRLKNWHPLTLLNVDNKIFAKILAKRLEKSFKYIIHYSQTGFIKGRYLAENILKINEIMQHCNSMGQSGVLTSYDFCKAFDSVEWPAIFWALEEFGFEPNYVAMVKILYTDPLVCATNNGYWLEYFHPTRATRQGGCYSPGIFNLVVELLGIGIRQNCYIRINPNTSKPKGIAFNA